MARKKRRFETVPAADTTEDTAPKPRYEDAFQQSVGKRIEDAAKTLEGHGRTILYGVAAVLVLGLIVWIIYAWMGRSSAEARTALGKAIETSQVAVSDQPAPAGSNQRTFPTQQARAEAAIAEFQAVVDKFGGEAGEKAKYFIAVNKMYVDRPAAIAELEALSGNEGEVGTLSKFALAQARENDGQLDQAATLYQELAAKADPILAKDTIELALASVYEKQGKNAEAANVLFELVKRAYEAKDADGNAITPGQTVQEARQKLESLDPERAKQLPEPQTPSTASPFGM